MKTLLISLGLTIFLGPGIGHLYLRQFKKAVILIAATLSIAVHLAWNAGKFITDSGPVSKENAGVVFQTFAQGHQSTMLIYDVLFAAIWAYALVDVFLWVKKNTPSKKNKPKKELDEE
ncbi:hypothetical protein ACFL58_01970 [Elusimicrobiota bacterium]